LPPARQDLRDRGAVPEIPTKRNRHVQHSVSRPLYALRSRIERFINRLKNSRRLATRYDKTADSFLGFVTLASIQLWITFVHAA
jgi:transposase